MEPTTASTNLSRAQKRFLRKHPHSKIVPGYSKTVIFYEHEDISVHRYIVSTEGNVLDHACFSASPGDYAEQERIENPDYVDKSKHINAYSVYQQGLAASSGDKR